MALLDHPFADRLPVSKVTVVNTVAPRAAVRTVLYRAGLKRLVDVLLVLATLPFWLPIILVTALIVARDGHNPFYTQPRIGRNGRVFRILKLRSMVHDADAVLDVYLRQNPAARAEWNATQKLKNDPRITDTGRFIRKISLDELPQLVNVLVGDMSLVGPRPMMVNQKSLYPGQRYYDMRPGLTGFWQISNRNHCRFAGRARYDNAYFNAMSLRTDVAVIWRTIGVVLRGTGY
ncbi:sugar transferase [Roseibacterium sp. SDUM158017]|nr:sugar transferase [Roseibacterium sp. SDUM158017]MDG4649605.1 sugar transferase [Roseibacterium sp. SDUM158017]